MSNPVRKIPKDNHARGDRPAFRVVPTGAALGAEIRGLDLARPLDDATAEALKAAWCEHLVLLFRGQRLSEDEHIAFSRGIGEVQPPNATSTSHFSGRYPEILVVSNIGPDGRAKDFGLGNAEAVWHADMTYLPEPPAGCALYARQVPPTGGDTWFCNLVLAWETLPADLREAVEGRCCVHDESRNSAGRLRPGYTEEPDPRRTPGPLHPLVRTHPVTGKKALFLGRRPFAYVPGLELAESETLLDRLWEHTARPAHTWAHRWRDGDLLLWDNRATLHRRDAFDMDQPRILHRTQIRGGRPH